MCASSPYVVNRRVWVRLIQTYPKRIARRRLSVGCMAMGVGIAVWSTHTLLHPCLWWIAVCMAGPDSSIWQKLLEE